MHTRCIASDTRCIAFDFIFHGCGRPERKSDWMRTCSLTSAPSVRTGPTAIFNVFAENNFLSLSRQVDPHPSVDRAVRLFKGVEL